MTQTLMTCFVTPISHGYYIINIFIHVFIHFVSAFQNEGPDEGVEASSLQGRLPSLTRKMKKMCTQLQKKNPAPELAEDLDCFTGNETQLLTLNIRD